MCHVRKCFGCAGFVLLFTSVSFAADYAKEVKFKESQDKVLEAAERAARRIGASVDARTEAGPLTFSSRRDLVQGVTGFKGTFTCEREPRTGKTIGHLRMTAVSWSQADVYKTDGTSLARVISNRFFATLREELGLCTNCAPPNIRGGIITPKVPPVDPRMPQ